MKFDKYMLELWQLAGEIGTLGEKNPKYALIYEKLSIALDDAEQIGLILEENVDL